MMESNVVLTELLKNTSNDRVLFSHKNGDITYGDLCKIKEKNRLVLDRIRGSNVVILAESRLNFAILCYLLDGTTNTILFLPSDISKDLHEMYINSAQINYRVMLAEDGELIIEQYPDIEMCINFDKNIKTYWIIPTSGTTSNPKLIKHTLSNLIRTTKTDSSIGSKFTWGLVYDIYRFAGIQVYLQALLGGAKLIIPDAQDSITEMISLFVKHNCNALSATPSYWRKMSMNPLFDKFSLEIISLGGEIADQTILTFLDKKFPVAKITHIYASTEAGVGFHVSDKKSGFPVSYLKNDKYRASINDEGTLCFRDENNQYVSTGDLVEIREDRVFFLGRDSGSINVGGNKVLPEEIEGVILQDEHVKEVRVYGMKNAFLGNLVCAEVVLKSEIAADEHIIRQKILSKCKEMLVGFKVPAKITFVENIVVTNSGKVKR